MGNKRYDNLLYIGNALGTTHNYAISQEKVEDRVTQEEHFDTVTEHCILNFRH